MPQKTVIIKRVFEFDPLTGQFFTEVTTRSPLTQNECLYGLICCLIGIGAVGVFCWLTQ